MAIKVHKVQGKTIISISVHCKGYFQYSQLYVAISRVKSLSRMQLACFDFKQIKTRMQLTCFDFKKIQNSIYTVTLSNKPQEAMQFAAK